MLLQKKISDILNSKYQIYLLNFIKILCLPKFIVCDIVKLCPTKLQYINLCKYIVQDEYKFDSDVNFVNKIQQYNNRPTFKKNYVTFYTCYKCKHNEFTVEDKQLSSIDEMVTTIARCVHCGNSFVPKV